MSHILDFGFAASWPVLLDEFAEFLLASRVGGAAGSAKT